MSLEEQKQSILKNFDFGKVYKVMEFLDWRWYGRGETPTIGELYQHAEDSLNQVISKKIISTSSGGFKAERHDMEDGVELELSFIVESMREVDDTTDCTAE